MKVTLLLLAALVGSTIVAPIKALPGDVVGQQ